MKSSTNCIVMRLKVTMQNVSARGDREDVLILVFIIKKNISEGNDRVYISDIELYLIQKNTIMRL